MILYYIFFLYLNASPTSAGCDYDPTSPVFTQKYASDSPALTWTWEWQQKISKVENTVGWPAYKFMPDAHMSAVKDEERDVWYTFYPNFKSSRTRGYLPFPDWAEELDPKDTVVGGNRVEEDVYDNGGDWLMSVHHTGPEQSLIGFIHAEDHFWDNEEGFPGHIAYKSIALGKSIHYVITHTFTYLDLGNR